MSEQGPRPPRSADDAIQAALESVERIERERKHASETDDLDPEQIEVLPATDVPPPATSGETFEDDVPLVEEQPKKSPQEAMLAAMIAAKNEAVNALEQTQKEAASLRERLLRTTADLENFKKRMNREKSDAIRFANEGMLKDLLPVLDNLDRSVDSMAAAAAGGLDADAAKNMVNGVAMVAKQFTDTLAKFGVKSFSAANGRFNPALHEAVGTREDPSIPRDTVVEEYQRGYMLNDRLARPAMVVVSVGGPAPEASPPTPATVPGDDGEGADEA